MKPTVMRRTQVCFSILAIAALVSTGGCNGKSAVVEDIPPGVVIEQTGMISLQKKTAMAVTSAPPGVMKGSGLIGVVGGARVKVLKEDTHEVLLPMPQLADTQIPLTYAVTTTPRECGIEYRLSKRKDANVVVTLHLSGNRQQEIQIDWASVILVSNELAAQNLSRPELYLRETACVQSGAEPVTRLADRLWPEDGRIDAYAANIQEFIRNAKQEKQPRSMDALGILESGVNWICTANANLAAALLRAKGIPSRSIAVIPPTAQRLEMHRIVEYFDGDRWLKFDPSSLCRDIPMKPCQSVIMCNTTIDDENLAMRPRLGVSLGCPYGQEVEFLDGGMTLWGNDFFWTVAKPLAEFEPTDEAIGLATEEWIRFLETGRLGQNQIEAASARDAAGFLEALRTR